MEERKNESLICLTLTCKTIAEDLALVEKYRKYIDLVELRADYLDEDECLQIRKFPGLAKIPCILTIRRRIDGGAYVGGEASRTQLFARAMAFADTDPEKNFHYVDFEEDFYVPSLQDAALAYGSKIIRSYHNMTDPVTDIVKRCNEMRKTGYEIPKIAFMPHSLDDVTNLFRETKDFTDYPHILCAMGPLGTPSRILSHKIHSYLTYTSPEETNGNLQSIGHMDPVTLNEVYNFRALNENTKVYAITGWPLAKTSSPALHGAGYRKHGMDAVFVPVRTPNVTEALDFAEVAGIDAFAVTIPHKENVIPELEEIDAETGEIKASNTIVRRDSKWFGYNTDAYGCMTALQEFLGVKNLKKMKVSIIGAGGAAKAVAYAVKKLGGKACIFNRTVSRAKTIAEMFGFKYAPLNIDSRELVEKYSDLIIQTSSVGMGSNEPSNETNDPLYFYQFKGHEALYDIVYVPEVTPIMQRAMDAGCRAENGYSMLKYQGYKQFKIFTGVDYE